MNWQPKTIQIFRVNFPRLGVAAIIVLCIAGLSSSGWLKPFDLLLYDWGQKLANRPASENVLIIGIDDASLAEIGRWPWSRDYHARLLEKLHRASPKAIVLDIIFAEPDLQNPQSDQQLADTIGNAGNIFLPVYISQSLNDKQLLEVSPISQFASRAAGLGHVHYENDEDGVCRSVYLKEGLGEPSWPHIAVEVAAFLGQINLDQLPGERRLEQITLNTLKVQRDYRNQIPFSGANQRFVSVSYVDVLNGKISDDLIKNKVIFVGATAAGLGDRVVTPTSSEEVTLNGVELNATIYQALVQHQFIHVISTKGYWLFTLLASLSITLISAFLAPRALMLFLLLGIGVTNASALAALNTLGFWIPPTGVSIAFLLSYLLWSLLRLQQALAYFRRELKQLAQEKSIIEQPQNSVGLYSGLEFLSSIIPLKGWLVKSAAGEVKSQGEVSSTAVVEEPRLHIWKHSGSISSIQIECEDKPYNLYLFWEKGSGQMLSEAELGMLAALIAPFMGRAPTDLPTAPEAITAAILQLNQANSSFREVSHFAQHSLASMVDGVAITDKSGRLLFENEVFKKLVGISDQHFSGQILELLERLTLVMDESWQQELVAFYKTGKPVQSEAVNFEQRHLLCQAHTLSGDSDEQFVIFVLTDISILKEYERARDETLNFLSHDLRSPLVSILAIIELARNRKWKENPDAMLDEIEKYADKNLKVADNFLHYARAEASNEVNFELTDLHRVVSGAIDEVFRQAEFRGITFHQAICDEDIWIMGQGDLLERAVTNLLSNAIKFSQPESTIFIELKVENGRAICQVRDQGVGITAEDIKNIFERFKRASSGAAKERLGAGLGLRFVDVVMRRHKGSIAVTSEPGQGATFTISLPLYVGDADFFHQ